MKYWVTRARGDWIPGQPHPGYDEYEDDNPTGRISGDGLMTTIDTTIIEAEVVAAIAAGTVEVVQPESVEPAPTPSLYSGLKRRLSTDVHFRNAIAKFDNGSVLTDIELRHLLQFYGIMTRMTEIVGIPYVIFHDDALNRHRRLTEIAAERGWTQSLMDMYGTMVEGIFNKIC